MFARRDCSAVAAPSRAPSGGSCGAIVTTHDADYRAEKAHSYATARRRRCRRGAQFSAADMARVARLVRRRYSPEQIVGSVEGDGGLRISHETIYRRIRWDKRAGGDLWRYTRIISKFGRKRYRRHDSRGVLPARGPSATGRPKSSCASASATGRATP